MAGGTLTTMDKVLKEFYLPPIQDQFSSKKALLYKIERGRKQDVRGKSFIIPLATARSQGTGARAEDGTLPTAGNVTWNNMTPTMRYNYAVIRVTGPSIDAAKSDRGSFVRSLDAEVKGAEESLLRSVNRQLNGNGSGVLNVCGTTSSSTTVVMLDTQFLEVGMTIDIRTMADGTVVSSASARTIVSIIAGTSFVISGAAVSTTTGLDAVYIAGARNIEMMGILGAISDIDPDATEPDDTGADTGYGSFQGLAVATNAFWKSTRLTAAANREISVKLMQDLVTEIDLASGKGDEVNFAYSRHGQFNKFGLLLVNDRRYAGNNVSFEGGFKYLSFDEVQWYFDRDCRKNRVFMANLSDLKIYQMSQVRWADREGHVLKWDANKDAWQAFLYWYAELGLGKRFCHGVLEALSE